MSENGSLAQQQHQRITEALKRIVEPVRQEVAEIDKRLADLDAERMELAAARKEAMAVLRAADPAERAKVHRGQTKKHRRGADGLSSHEREVTARIEKLLRSNPQPGGAGLTRNWIVDQLEGVGQGPALKALDALVDSGFIRRDKKTKGGGLAYALVETDD